MSDPDNGYMKRLVLPVLMAVPLLLPATPAHAAPSAQPTAYEKDVLRYTNAERAKRGLRPLALSTCATYYARRWSAHMRSRNALSHQSLSTIMTSCGGRRAGENVAYGNVSARALVTMWMNSSGHRANILNANYRTLGVGTVVGTNGRVWATQDFLG